MGNDIKTIVKKNAKLASPGDNSSPEYNDKIQHAYVRQDKLLAQKLGEHHVTCMSELASAFAAGDKDSFDAAFSKCSKAATMLGASDDDAAAYLAEIEDEGGDKSEGKDEKLAEFKDELQGISAKLAALDDKITAKLAAPEEEDEAKKTLAEMKSLIQKLEEGGTK